ncbi:MAG: SirB2 family protein [Betaproteobacteria bacterium]
MSSTYAVLKGLHVGSVATSLALFVLRGVWMLYFPTRLAQRWVRIVPHIVDTVLLASAIGLAAMLGIDPATRGWLAAKVVGLLVYIALGTIALKRGRTRSIRLAAFVGALATFGYIVSVAIAKSPAGFFAGL